MLKKILNKKLLVALVIGSSLGLTNVGICSHSDIVINEVDCFEYEGNVNVPPIKVSQLVKDFVQQTYGVGQELIGEDPVDLANCGIGLFADNFQTKDGATALKDELVPAMKDVGYADIEDGDNFVLGIAIKDRKDDALWLRGQLSTIRDFDGYGVAYRLYETFTGADYYAALRKSSPEEVSKKSDEVTKLKNNVTKLKNDVNSLLSAIGSVKDSLQKIDKSITDLNMGENQLQLNIDNSAGILRSEFKEQIVNATQSLEEKIKQLSKKIDVVNIEPNERPIIPPKRKIVTMPSTTTNINRRNITTTTNPNNLNENKINLDENKIEELKINEENNEENKTTKVTEGKKRKLYKAKRYGV